MQNKNEFQKSQKHIVINHHSKVYKGKPKFTPSRTFIDAEVEKWLKAGNKIKPWSNDEQKTKPQRENLEDFFNDQPDIYGLI